MDERATIGQDDRAQDHAETEPHERDVGHRVQAGDTRLVHERVARDRQPGHDRPRRSRADLAAGRARLGRIAAERDDPEHDETDAERAEPREALAENGQRDQRDEGDAEPACHRIDA